MSILKSVNSGKERLKLYFSDFHERGYIFSKDQTKALYRNVNNLSVSVKTEREEHDNLVRFVVKKAKLYILSKETGTLYEFDIISHEDLDLATRYFEAYRQKEGWARIEQQIIGIVKDRWIKYRNTRFPDWK